MDVQQLLALHPWPAELASERRLDFLWTFELPVSPDVLWPVMSDTSRMNRALGLSPMTFREEGGRRLGASRNGGVAHEWVEVPWDWVAGQWLTSTRLYSRGFLKAMFAVHHLEPIERGTRLYLYFGAIPAGVFGSSALRLGFPSIEKAYRKLLPALAHQLGQPAPELLQLRPPPLTSEAEARVAAIRARLIEAGLDVGCLDALLDHVRTGDDQDLGRIQLRACARAWSKPERDLLRVALHATRAGLLELSWDVVCPHCRGVREEDARIAELNPTATCDVCDVTFGTGEPESVEVTFRVHSSVREVPTQMFCSAEPAKKDHIRVQHMVGPGARAEVTPRLAPGRYRARTNLGMACRYLTIAADGAAAWAWSPDGTAGDELTLAPSAVITLVGPATGPAMFVIERCSWRDDALRPGDLLSSQDFRDLFSDDYLTAGVQLSVGQQTILFTDMVGSTRFYAERGDPGAFAEVKRHFDEVFAIIAAHRGAVVKTIGDACMATFVDPLDAVRASHAIHDAYPPSRTDSPVRLRISLNTGPCIAVRLNSTLDYFGGTVNVSAKLQALAEEWQVAMSEATYHSPGVAEYLQAHGARLSELAYTSKALPAPIAVWQWTVYAAPTT